MIKNVSIRILKNIWSDNAFIIQESLIKGGSIAYTWEKDNRARLFKPHLSILSNFPVSK